MQKTQNVDNLLRKKWQKFIKLSRNWTMRIHKHCVLSKLCKFIHPFQLNQTSVIHRVQSSFFCECFANSELISLKLLWKCRLLILITFSCKKTPHYLYINIISFFFNVRIISFSFSFLPASLISLQTNSFIVCNNNN